MIKDKYIKDSWYDKLPNSSLEVSEEYLLGFFEMMTDRQNIFCNKAFKTNYNVNDLILLQNKFTNVYRELDRSSQFLITQILLDKDNSDEDIFWKIIVYRLFNNPETFLYLSKKNGIKSGIPKAKDFDEDYFYDLIKQYRNKFGNPFTNAYYVNSTFCSGVEKDECYIKFVLPFLKDYLQTILQNLYEIKDVKKFVKSLEKIPGVGSFISHEFYQDFTYIEKYTDKKIFNWNQNDFTNVGPGCELGLRIIFPNLKNISEKEDKIFELKELANNGILKDLNFNFLNYDKKSQKYYISENGEISAHQIEFQLCEFSKYWKMKIEGGKQRSKYQSKVINKDYSFYLY